jgi:Ca-activated chloride channel homolog
MRVKYLLRFLLLGIVWNSYGQIPLDSLHGSMCGMIDPVTKLQVPISPVFTRVNVVITDAIAQVVVSQRFVNPFRAKSEAVYLFPLPDQGSVHGMKYEYHDSIYVAEIMEKSKAIAIYDSIKHQGGQAALLLQERPNIFMQRIATLGAGDTAYIEIKLSVPLKFVDGEMELAFPTRIGPRFQSGVTKVTANGPVSDWNPPEDRSGPELQINVMVESGVDLSSITSPSHPIEVSELALAKKTLTDRNVIGGDIVPRLSFVRGVLLKTQATYPNRDYVLRLKRGKTAPDFSLAVSQDTKGQGYFMLNLYPDPTLFAGKRPDLEVIMLMDISGSQYGWPLDREKEIALNILSRLTPNDNVDVLSFSDIVYYAYGNNTPVPATAQNIAKGETFIRQQQTVGGTQLLAGVNAALAVPVKAEKHRVFIFLTDGFITNETAILEAIANHPSKPSIFTFGAGNSLNRYFLEQCAKVGNGFATPMVEGDASGPLVDAAWKRIEAPQMENIQVSFDGLETSDLLYPISNRLFMGLPYRVSGKFGGGGKHSIVLTGDKEGVPVSIAKEIDFSSTDAFAWAIPKLWAREKIDQLVLAQGTKETNKAAIIAVSTEYQVLCGYTAFLAATAQKATLDNTISGNMPTNNRLTEALSSSPFGLTMHGGLLFLDWKGSAKVVAIRIYDLHGHLLFTYLPGAQSHLISQWIWDGRNSQGRVLGHGRYLISVQTQNGLQNQTFTWDPKL